MRTIRLERRTAPAEPVVEDLESLDATALLGALRGLRNGDFRVRLVEQHGGEIAVKSEVGDTTFTVRLPLMLEPLELLEA